MGRARLSPEEREARRLERKARFWGNLDSNYNHYDPDISGYGSPDDWEQIAELLAGVKTRPIGAERPKGRFARELGLLGLLVLPNSLESLRKAFRAAMFKAHPDYGGTNQAARETMQAFAVLKTQVVA